MNLNLEMVKAALARDVAEDEWTLAKAESDARKATRGLWADRQKPKNPAVIAEFNEATEPSTAGRVVAPLRW